MAIFHEGFRLQLVSELSELVEIDAWPEAKRVRDGLRGWMRVFCSFLA